MDVDTSKTRTARQYTAQLVQASASSGANKGMPPPPKKTMAWPLQHGRITAVTFPGFDCRYAARAYA